MRIEAARCKETALLTIVVGGGGTSKYRCGPRGTETNKQIDRTRRPWRTLAVTAVGHKSSRRWIQIGEASATAVTTM